MGRGRLVSIAVVAALVLAGGVASSRSAVTTVWRGDFETGDLSQWAAVQAKKPNRITIQHRIVREGRYAARVEVRPGDDNVAGSGSGERAEVFIGGAATGSTEGTEQYWAWSTYFPREFDAPAGLWNALLQFHHSGSTGPTNLNVVVRDRSQLVLRTRGGNFASSTGRDFALGRLQAGRWYDFVLHVKWSSSNRAGFVEMWVNGFRVIPRTAVATLYVGQSVYLKLGFYRAQYGEPTVLYHDGMRRGSRLSEVADWARGFDPQ